LENAKTQSVVFTANSEQNGNLEKLNKTLEEDVEKVLRGETFVGKMEEVTKLVEGERIFAMKCAKWLQTKWLHPLLS
tara:strand:- start:304 stop:534 length:231 start_codon:yes stop_codon:yes gene_type:complete